MNKEPINQFNYELVNIDMRDLYIDIICNGVECPEVIVVKELEDGSIIQRRIMENGNCIYYLKYADDMYDVLISELKNGNANEVECLPFENHELTNEEVMKWIACTTTIADMLDVGCPQIMFTPFEDAGVFGGEGLLVLSGTNPEKPYFEIETFVCIAHELRHEWQHKYHPAWFKDYVQVESEMDMDKYLNHKSEIDAESYARKLAGIVFGIDLFKGGDKALMEKMIRTAKDIDISVSEEDKEYFWCLFDIE